MKSFYMSLLGLEYYSSSRQKKEFGFSRCLLDLKGICESLKIEVDFSAGSSVVLAKGEGKPQIKLPQVLTASDKQAILSLLLALDRERR